MATIRRRLEAAERMTAQRSAQRQPVAAEDTREAVKRAIDALERGELLPQHDHSDTPAAAIILERLARIAATRDPLRIVRKGDNEHENTTETH